MLAVGFSGLPSAKIFLCMSIDFCFVRMEVLLGMGFGGKGKLCQSPWMVRALARGDW